MPRITKTFEVSWLSLDSWSETYVGTKWLLDNVLPNNIHEMAPEHGPISQMVLLGSHQLIENILYNCIRKHLELGGQIEQDIESTLKSLRFEDALKTTPQELTNRKLPLGRQPLQSVATLQNRRNDTVHYRSTLATPQMARSAFYTAVMGSKEIYSHFYPEEEFKYEVVLRKYPVTAQPLLSKEMFPENIAKRNT